MPPISDFTRTPSIDAVVPSPSGRRMAVLSYGDNGRRRLLVIDLDPLSEPRPVASFGDADITTVRWVNDDRLIFEAYQDGAVISGAGTFAVDHDGKGYRQLIAWRQSGATGSASQIGSRVLPYGWFLHSTLDDGGAEVLVYKLTWDALGDSKDVQLARLHTETGLLRTMSLGMPEGARAWLVDASGEPKFLSTYVDGRVGVHWRAGADAPWTRVADFDPFETGFSPWHVDAEGRVLVTARRGTDTQGLHVFDPAKGEIVAEPLIRLKGFDLDPAPVADTRSGRLLGVHFMADRPMSYWFDDSLQRVQQSVDAALPKGRSNRLLCGRCTSARFIVVRSSDDRQPAEYFLHDREKASLESLGASRPWLDAAKQATRSFHRLTTRDGLSMPLYVTHPAGSSAKQALPTVVLVHGGPWVRGSDRTWKSEAQFLASRGYRVLEPEFRGSEGYGYAHFKAGWKQWGTTMQYDLADAVRWAGEQGLSEPSRVCVMGGSYGGYAALMSLIANPGVFKCAVGESALVDIELFYALHRSDLPETARLYSLPRLVGDRTRDAGLLAAASPLKRVTEIKVPVLLSHGALARRIVVEHAEAMSQAARTAGVPIERVIYPDESQGFFLERNRIDFYQRVERFLAHHLGAPAP